MQWLKACTRDDDRHKQMRESNFDRHLAMDVVLCDCADWDVREQDFSQ